jgi:hypothetical protein
MPSTPHLIAHRVNTLADLQALPNGVGLEIDIRDHGDQLVLQHDPFKGDTGEPLEPFLAAYHHGAHGTLILNIKSERVELRVLELLRRFGIEDYFFLDSSIPLMVLLSRQGEDRMAVRLSEVEPPGLALAFAGKARWVWIDCFEGLPINGPTARQLKEAGFRLCLVSPELQGRPDDVAGVYRQLLTEGIALDALCTKAYMMPTWQQLYAAQAVAP